LKKIQQFFILKISSERLKKSNYSIEISLDNAKINKEVITINNSSLLRTLFRYKNINFEQDKLDSLLILQKKIRKAENTDENKIKLEKISKKIEKMLFVEDLINIEFENKSHYLAILKNKGFYVNGIRFVPFMASSGMIRKNTAMFINNNIKHPIMDILENGRDEKEPLVAVKLGAYFSLYCSSTLPVSFPKFAVVPDKEIETIKKVDLVTYKGVDEDDDVKETDYTLKLNAFDGQGLITPRLAEQWSRELELDYIFSCTIIRAPFLKGLVAVFDIQSFGEEIAKTYEFTDIYGDKQDIRNLDLIISESMFKLWSSYENTKSYITNCHKNKLGFSIAKVNPKEEKSYSRTSYQFLQVLNLNDADIANLCKPTIDWFRNISGGSAQDMLLYATGENHFKADNYNKMDATVKAILLNPELSRDKYIQNKFIKTIEKKKKDSYMGRILINANYQFMIADPFYHASHIFNLNKQPLLKDGEHYSQYWLDNKIKKVCAIRSPIVHHSEVNILNFHDKKDTQKWYSHIHSGIIFPANGIGIDCVIHGGADFDGDIICTINNPTMIKGKISGIPIVYESKKMEKEIVDLRNDKKQVEGQLNGYYSKLGFATNISSSLYSLLEEFPKESVEYNTILKRLKIGRAIQGEIIDGVKGLKIPPFRNHWIKYKNITKDMTPEEKEKWRFNNKIVCQIRPSFFRFLYQNYMSKYNKELKKYNLYSHLNFQKSFDDILKSKIRTKEEDRTVQSYKINSFFLDNNSTINRLSRYMRANLGLIGKYSSKSSKESDYNLLKNNIYKSNVYNLIQMKKYLQEYKTFKKGLRNNFTSSYANLDSFLSYLKKECSINISSNEAELANYAIDVTYGDEVSLIEFAWKLFPNGILQNIMENSSGTIKIPTRDINGNIDYLWNKYSIKELSLGEIYED